MNFTPELVEREPRPLLSLEAVVHVRFGVGRTNEHGRQAAHDDAENRENSEEFDQGVTALSAEEACASPAECLHRSLASTAARTERATDSLRPPMPHWASTRRSTLIRIRRAAPPCHQPNLAPVTIQAC